MIPYRKTERGSPRVTPLLAQEDDWCISRLAEENMYPMPVAIEHKTLPRWPTVTHRPVNHQSYQFVESIANINEGCSTWLRILR